MKKIIISAFCTLLLVSCNLSDNNKKQKNTMKTDTLKQYGYNLDFLKKHVTVVELINKNSSVAIVPSWQGRGMTSTSEGDSGFSFWGIYYQLFSLSKKLKHL